MSRLNHVRLAILLGVALTALVRPASAQLARVETEHLQIIYEKTTQSWLVPYVAQCFENSIRYHMEHFSYEPQETITIVLTDFGDAGNAAAGTNPRNAVSIIISPMLLAYETYPANERINTLANHELVHVVTLDQAEGSDNTFRHLFHGKVRETSDHPETIAYGFLTTPRNSTPPWYREGIAVFIETWMAGGLGRAQGAYDEMVFRAKVADQTFFYDPLSLESEGVLVDFMVGVNSYLYGTRFMSYLAYEYSPEKLMEWVSRRGESAKYYATQFQNVFGASLDEVWSEWVEWERGFQAGNLAAIRQYPVTPYRDLTDRGLGSISRMFLDRDAQEIYAAINYPGALGHIAAISLRDGSIRKIREVKGPALFVVTSLAYDPEARKLFYTTDNYGLRDLIMLDPDTGKSRVLLKNARIGDLVFNQADRSLWGIRHFNAKATLVRIPHPYEEWQTVHSWPYGQVIYDIDISPDGERLSASIAEVSGRQTLRIMNTASLLEGDTTSTASLGFGYSVPSNFVFSDDGTKVYGSSYYTGTSNIFRYDIAADTLDALTNAETGFFRPIPLGGDSLIVARYTGDGFVPAVIAERAIEDVSPVAFFGQMLAEKHPVIQRWIAPSPGSLDAESLVLSEGTYEPLGNVGVESIYPITEGYKDYPAYGLRVNLSDPLYIHRFDLDATWSPNTRLPADERLHVEAGYSRNDWSVKFTHNDADFYDLFGPTKTSRKGSSLGLSYEKTLFDDAPKHLQFSSGLTGYAGLERLPDYQNVASSFGELIAASVSLGYRNRTLSLGAVDFEKGVEATGDLSATYVNRKLYPTTYGSLDLGFPLPVHHTSLWLRTSAGYSPGDRDQPFANFFLGGFGNNYVDHRSVKRYREPYAFPGVELNEIGGTNYGRVMLDLNLPPVRFRRLGFTSLYVTWARPSLFATGVVTNIDDDPTRREVVNLGSQVDFRMTLLSHLRMTLSVGYAAAFEDQARPRDEFMLSLKIL